MKRIATKEDIKEGDKVIALVEEYAGRGEEAFDGDVLYTTDKGVAICYLSGYKSRTDDITWDKILAKVDKRRKWVDLKGINYSGNFQIFNAETE